LGIIGRKLLMGTLLGIHIIRVNINILKELIMRQEEFLALPASEYPGNYIYNNQVSLILRFA